ncbi:hypothetical protein [Gemmata sp.]|uniref:hypothetical protein n=1 Tax=Gemmata sp. TaxID=1914242 RepID=UPI003F6ED529
MNIAVVALVGATLGQPPAAAPGPDYFPLNSRKIDLPIKYERDRKTIRQMKLFVARNGENTWYQEAAVPPDRDKFTFMAKEDGLYWFTMQEEDLQGKNLPANLINTPPDLKVLVDTVQPRVQFTNARKNGDDVVVEWSVDDKNPDDTKTQVHFRPASGEGYWQEVTLPASSKSGVRFPAGPGAVTVRVTVQDVAGNKTEATREIGGTGATTALSSPMSGPAAPTGPVSPASGGTAQIPSPDFNPVVSAGPVAPAAPPTPTPPAPVPTPAPAPVAQAAPVVPQPPAATNTPPAPAAQVATGPTVLPTVDPRQPVVPASPTGGVPPGGPVPVAVWTAGNAAAAPTVEVSRAQYLNYLAFDMGYEVESRGPSGISRLDLWVTRDDGRTWMKWSQHDGKQQTVRVNLSVPNNPLPEGNYGFRVVPVSGAGLSEREPAGGDAPDLRVVVDVTAPTLDLFPPTGDPTSPDTLVVQWKAADKNFGEDPITIEWSDKPTGPWQPAAAAELAQTTAGQPVAARRLPNTGQFAWRVPAGLPPRVYLKVAARDAAGNVKEVVTREPILVDLVKPRAKISGIVTPAGGVARP